MNIIDWKILLTDLSNTLISSNKFKVDIPKEALKSNWLGYSPASETEIVEVENRLGVILPPSYRNFLLVSNGWYQLNSTIYTLLPVKEIDWFINMHPEWVDELSKENYLVSDEDYFVYGGLQKEFNVRWDYLKTTLQVSGIGDAAYLVLNPMVVTPDGEWEAWIFASWMGGARRFRSFWDLVQSEYKNFITY